jgi:hypothetical protein
VTLRRALGFWLVSALLDVLGARLLDSLGLIEGLLSPSGASALVLLPLAVAFYGARLAARFVAPGLVLGALLVAAFVSFRPSARQRV